MEEYGGLDDYRHIISLPDIKVRIEFNPGMILYIHKKKVLNFSTNSIKEHGIAI